MKKVRKYGHLWDKKELTKAEKELERWNKAFQKNMRDIKIAKSKGVASYKKFKLKKLPKVGKSGLKLSKQAHEAI